jgi:hypothetical protein
MCFVSTGALAYLWIVGVVVSTMVVAMSLFRIWAFYMFESTKHRTVKNTWKALMSIA